MELLKEHSAILQQRYDVLLDNLAAMKMQYKEEQQASAKDLREMSDLVTKLNRQLKGKDGKAPKDSFKKRVADVAQSAWKQDIQTAGVLYWKMLDEFSCCRLT